LIASIKVTVREQKAIVSQRMITAIIIIIIKNQMGRNLVGVERRPPEQRLASHQVANGKRIRVRPM